ncbi:thiamine phosphate synthase [Aquibium sp. A9E412]|uniref:thiamine phosphate synthase n=1 Tax=Aquibium sp. A9E412 TaxID=2976767 RepID=UPI0025B0055D|nr:thiamine phosphate synthase [Aquibium sp. A9E412]MDN2565335.1 thiamine phosphate synthase [Aquibium sp. A9E412]
MTARPVTDRCRLVLIAPPPADGDVAALAAALSGGDVASLIVPAHGLDDDALQARAEALIAEAHRRDVAVVLEAEPRIAARTGADGIHVEAGKAALADLVARHRDRLMVGCGGARTRDDALELGEAQPDYIFFGRFGYDGKEEPHPRNLALGRWWAEMIRIPCIVLGGAAIASVETVAATGAEFVALSQAVFAAPDGPAAAVARANAVLDETAPHLEA